MKIYGKMEIFRISEKCTEKNRKKEISPQYKKQYQYKRKLAIAVCVCVSD